MKLNGGTIFRLCGWLEEPAAGLPERDIEIAISVLFSLAKFRYVFILVINPGQN